MSRYTHVLVIDDQRHLADLAGRALKGSGHILASRESVETAVSDPGLGTIHVVVANAASLGGDGAPTLKARWPNIGIVAATAEPTGTVAAARRAGAHRLAHEPFSHRELQGLILGLVDLGYGTKARKARILAIEDSPTVGAFLSVTLRGAGHDVEVFPSLDEAIESPGALGIDLILADVFQPGFGGLEHLARVRDCWPGVPMLAVSGGLGETPGDEDTLAEAARLGADITVAGPLNAEDLTARVATLLNDRQA